MQNSEVRKAWPCKEPCHNSQDFRDTRDWFARTYLGNEAGPIAPMIVIEIFRTGLCWPALNEGSGNQIRQAGSPGSG
jgi:hypothetical protein